VSTHLSLKPQTQLGFGGTQHLSYDHLYSEDDD